MTLTVLQLHRNIRQRLEPVTHSLQQAEVETDWLLQGLLGLTQEQRYIQAEQIVSPSDAERVQNFITLRVEKRIPIQYLLHEAWFFGLSFYVNPHVLIPRPETELLVEQALALAKPNMRILDVGTGPGTIAISIATQLKDQSIVIVATDISEHALKVAQLNQKRHGTSVDFRSGDLFSALLPKENFDIIISNPPYIDRALQSSLMPEVQWHEPALALFPPTEDAYYFYRQLAKYSKDHLKPGGILLMEMGAEMSPMIQQVLKDASYQAIEIFPDYAGIERIIKAVF
jgi:release factor glutamine methyltransferase